MKLDVFEVDVVAQSRRCSMMYNAETRLLSKEAGNVVGRNASKQGRSITGIPSTVIAG